MKITKKQLYGLIQEAVKQNGGNENVQKKVVESVKRKLNEGDDFLSNREDQYKRYFYGVKPYRVLYYNDWTDPNITDGKKVVNYYAIEDSLYENFKDSDDFQIYGGEKGFEQWVLDNQQYVKEYFDMAEDVRRG